MRFYRQGASFYSPRYSPDGKRIALTISSSSRSDIPRASLALLSRFPIMVFSALVGLQIDFTNCCL